MISQFTIENFLSIKESQTISFEPTADSFLSDEYTITLKNGVKLLKLGIIYGSNSSGKSNILKAFDFFRNLVYRKPQNKNEEIGVTPFLLDDTSRNNVTKMSMVFYVNSTKYILSYELDNKRIYSETLIAYDSIRPTKIYNRTYNKFTDSSDIYFSGHLKMRKKNQEIIKGNTTNNCSVLAAFGSSNVEKTRINDIYNYFVFYINSVLKPDVILSTYIKNNLKRASDEGLKSFILKLLKASDFNIDDMHLHEKNESINETMGQFVLKNSIPKSIKEEFPKQDKISNNEISFSHIIGNNKYNLPERYESDGTLHFIGIAIILYHLIKEDNFFLIDEVETSLHRELLSYFIKLFLVNSTTESQLLITTYDTTLLDEDFIRRDTIWFTDKNEVGQTHIVRLSALGLHKNLSPYNAYKQGKLVKLPFLGSLYIDNI